MKQTASEALLGLLFNREYGGDMFLRNFRSLSTDYTGLHSVKQSPSEMTLRLQKHLRSQVSYLNVEVLTLILSSYEPGLISALL
jgi:hypothetical protein